MAPGQSCVVPDMVLSSQLDEVTDRRRSGERRLLFAVLRGGIVTSLGRSFSSRKGRRGELAQARRWVNARDSAVMSFSWICTQLGIEAAQLREAIRVKGRG